MNNSKYKILVLSDLKNTTNSTLKTSVGLAKMINADVDFFYVKKAKETVESDSQLSAMRNINKLHTSTRNEIQNQIDGVSKDYDIKISHNHMFGNVKSEIRDYIKTHNPDVIVLGKRKPKSFNILGDNITNFVIKNFDGSIMIASNENTLEPNKKFSLGILNDKEKALNINITNSLIEHSQKPLKSFKIAKKTNELKEKSIGKETIEYVFEQTDNAINNLSNYLSKNNIDLLYLNRETDNKNTNSGIMKLDINKIISKTNTSLWIEGNQNPILN